jgi:hypothetical protein
MKLLPPSARTTASKRHETGRHIPEEIPVFCEFLRQVGLLLLHFRAVSNCLQGFCLLQATGSLLSCVTTVNMAVELRRRASHMEMRLLYFLFLSADLTENTQTY